MDFVEASIICSYYNVCIHIRLCREFVWRALWKLGLYNHTFELYKTKMLHNQ